jgi:hypothetical protein
VEEGEAYKVKTTKMTAKSNKTFGVGFLYASSILAQQPQQGASTSSFELWGDKKKHKSAMAFLF